MKSILWIAALPVSVVVVRAAEPRACPPWEVVVVDEEGKPMPGCAILQEWNCKFEHRFVTRSTNAVTDAEGRVLLAERWLPGPPERKGVDRMLENLSVKVEPEPSANVFVWKRGYEAVRVFSRRDPKVLVTRNGF